MKCNSQTSEKICITPLIFVPCGLPYDPAYSYAACSWFKLESPELVVWFQVGSDINGRCVCVAAFLLHAFIYTLQDFITATLKHTWLTAICCAFFTHCALQKLIKMAKVSRNKGFWPKFPHEWRLLKAKSKQSLNLWLQRSQD